MFGPIGGPEMVVILVIALLIFGPRKLPELAKSLGKGLSELRRTSTDLRRTLEQEIHQENVDEKPPVGGLPTGAPAAVPTSLGTGSGRDPEAAAPPVTGPGQDPQAVSPAQESSTWPDGRPGRPATTPSKETTPESSTKEASGEPSPDRPAAAPVKDSTPAAAQPADATDDRRPGDDH